jgi:hypothetical protein
MTFQRISDNLFPPLPEKANLQSSLFSSRRLIYFLITFIQLCLLLFVIRQFNIERASGISAVSIPLICAFTLNSFVPLRFRPFVFFITAVYIIFYAFGMVSGLFFTGTALILIACCHLPVPFAVRLLLILIIASGILILRLDLFYAPRASLVVPFIASAFMFRLIIYLYEVKHQMTKGAWIQSICYFFMFPNVCFLFFPIVDHKVFLRTYYQRNDTEIWQKGIRWMLRGVIHILLYRVLYYHVVIAPSDVTDLLSLLKYVLSSYALVLRLSGLFHFILGFMALFGLDLPQAFNNYFLASNFTDLWKRINIYWREFILKIFFYPVMFFLKKRIRKNTLQITIMIIFIITWFFHAYQWFWIRGYYVLNPLDFTFWLIIGMGITMSATIQERKALRSPEPVRQSRAYIIRMLQITGMLLFMSFMWSLWGSPSFADWKYLIMRGSIYTGNDLLLILFVIITFILGGFFIQVLLSRDNLFKRILELPSHKTAWLTLPCIGALFGISMALQNPQGEPLQYIASLSKEKLNKTDKATEDEGYYKKLLDGDNNNSTGLWEVNLKRPRKYNSMDEVYVRTNDLLTKTFRPNKKIRGEGFTFETNSIGLRDKEYLPQKPVNTFRMAMLGGSYEMGTGVSNDEVFESIAEKLLNEDPTIKHKTEILNYACGGFYLIQHVELCHTKVFDMQPDAVVYMAHTIERTRTLQTLSNLIIQGTNLKYPLLLELKKISGVNQSMSKTEIEERLKPYIDQVINWCYSEIVRSCKKNHASAVWVFLPTTSDPFDEEEYSATKAMAVKNGFIIVDLKNVYGTADKKLLILSEWNTHPNPAGHLIIGKGLYNGLKAVDSQLTELKK